MCIHSWEYVYYSVRSVAKNQIAHMTLVLHRCTGPTLWDCVGAGRAANRSVSPPAGQTHTLTLVFVKLLLSHTHTSLKSMYLCTQLPDSCDCGWSVAGTPLPAESVWAGHALLSQSGHSPQTYHAEVPGEQWGEHVYKYNLPKGSIPHKLFCHFFFRFLLY